MAYELNQPRTFFKIKGGKVIVKASETAKEYAYDSFTGYLQSIYYTEREIEYHGKQITIKSYNIVFADPLFADASPLHIWSPSPKSPLLFAFINSILSLDSLGFTQIKLQPYENDDGQQRLIVYGNGDKLQWKYSINEVPAITKLLNEKGKPLVDSDGNPLWDYAPRLNWIKEKVSEINAILNEVNKEKEVNIKNNTENNNKNNSLKKIKEIF